MRILIAEDEKDLNVLLKKRLENQKYSVDACCDGDCGSAEFILPLSGPH